MTPEELDAIRKQAERRQGSAAYMGEPPVGSSVWIGKALAALLAEVDRLIEERGRSGEFVRQLDLDRKRFAQQVADADIEVRKVKTIASRERTTLLAERNAARFQAVRWRNQAANNDPHCDPDSYMRAHPFDWETAE